MGTSTRWQGPRWRGLSTRLARWDTDRSDPGATVDAAIEDLWDACRRDPTAFGLRDTARSAGDRLAGAMAVLATEGPAGLIRPDPAEPWQDYADAFVTGLTRQVAGDGTSIADAAVRRAMGASVRRLLETHPEVRDAVSDPELAGRGWFGELLCFLYQWFFADLVTEFLQSVVAEKIKLTLPVLVIVDAEDRIADKIAERIVSLVPNPCEEIAADQDPGAAKAATDALSGEVEVPPLSDMARRLVPGTVGKILGFGIDSLIQDEGDAA
ncbi:hypothetical protein BGM09_02940 [Streptomyces sp. CBMA29]|nr:hypothetical protein [Streptomyces sp. CBMA29]